MLLISSWDRKYFVTEKILTKKDTMSILCLSLLLLGASVSAFRVKSANPSSVKVKLGKPFRVICTTDNWYEVRKRQRADLCRLGEK